MLTSSVHVWLATTNLMALLPICLAWYHQMRFEYVLVMCAAALSSVLMHLSETKHGLDPGPVWRPWASMCLNLDRICAYATALLGTLLWVQGGCSSIVLYVAFVGGACNVVGEWTTNVLVYVVLHTLWHVCAYGSLAMLLL
jgi:hypothetical protein